MKPETGFWARCLRGGFALLAIVVPLLVGYEIYFQLRAATLDFVFDVHSGLVHAVPGGSYADWAGLLPGDVILSVDGAAFTDWLIHGLLNPSAENYMLTVARNGRRLTIELPHISMAKANPLSLGSAIVAALIYWAIGGLLLLRRFHQPEVRLLYLLSQAFAVLLLFPLAHPAPLLVPRWAMALSSGSLYVAAPLLLHYYLTFPVRLGTPRQRRRRLGALYGAALISIGLWLSGHRLLLRLSQTYVVLEIAAAIFVLCYVYARRASPDGRRRLRLIVFGNVTAALAGILFYVLPRMLNIPFHAPEWLVALCLIAVPLSYLHAIVQHNLFGIDRFLNRTLVYALLSLGMLVLYLGPFLLIHRFLPGDLLAQMMLSAGLTLLVGLSFDWSRKRVQWLVDRLFYGGWYDYPGVVETISDALARSLDWEHLTDVLTHRVPALMHLHPGHLWIGAPDETVPPDSSGLHLRFVFPLEGRRCAAWTVEPRRDGEAFTPSDYRILKTLADQAEIALNNVLLVEMLRRQLGEIREAQRQLLRSREEERSRLARDLHDGPIQVLVGLNMQLGMLLTSLGNADSLPDASPATMRAEVRALLSELRQVCAELRPPLLDTIGLGAALSTLAEEWSAQCEVRVALDLPPDAALRSLPDDVAVNLYRVVQEALSNIAHHAEAHLTTIRLTWEDARLTLTIQDDGRGFVVPAILYDLTTAGHFGLVGMQERAGLIGADWVVDSTPGCGTTVRVVWQAPARDPEPAAS